MKNDNSNDRSINNVRLSLKKDYFKVKANGVKLKKDTDKIYINDLDDNSKNIVVESYIPFTFTIGATVIGLVTFSASNIAMALGDNREVVASLINGSRDFIKNTLVCSGISLSLPTITKVLVKKNFLNKTSKYKNGKLYSKKDRDVLEKKEKAIDFLSNLDNQEDKTVSFAREFFDNVDIRDNQKRYNKELIEKMAEYREALKKGNTVADVVDQMDRLKELKSFIRNSTIHDGASNSFLDNEYIKDFVKVEEKKKTKSKR